MYIPIGIVSVNHCQKAKFCHVVLYICVNVGASFDERLQAAYTLLETVPLIDAHNDLPYNIRKFVHNQLAEFNFDVDLKNVPPWSNSNWSHTDLQRLKKGRVAAQVEKKLISIYRRFSTSFFLVRSPTPMLIQSSKLID